MRSPSNHEEQDDNEDEYEDGDGDIVMDDSHIEILGHDDSEDEQEAVKQHAKSSTQRLHDKIEMLGKAPAPRPSNSIPSAMQITRQSGPAPRQHDKTIQAATDHDDSWIKP